MSKAAGAGEASALGELDRVRVMRSLGVLDSPAEERFDRISRVAALVAGTPVAHISLMDSDRLWVKSCMGLVQGSDYARDETICTVTLQVDAPLVIPDLTADPRFRELPLVAEGGMRAYVGHPLRVDGQTVGTLCVLDDEVRAFTDEQVERLGDLARWAEGELGAVELTAAIAQERQTSRDLQALQQRDELVLAAAETGVLVTDERGLIVVVNLAAERMVGRPREEMLKLDLHEALHRTADGVTHPRDDCPVLRALADRVPQRVTADVLVRPDGERAEISYAAAPLVVDGAVTGAVVTVEDITARRAVERLKDEFVSVVSHELRTPLTSIRGSLGLLTSGKFGDVPGPASRLLDIAVSNTDRLVRLVNDILDLERIESGAVQVELSVQPLHRLLQAARDNVAGTADAAGVALEVEPTAIEVATDGDLLVQALVNLVANAVKFSAPGAAVVLRAREEDGEVVVDVADSGRGIPADRLERVFERFEQVDASDAREKGGTGLGLAITRSLVVRMGGRLSATSELGVGSTFTVSLPAMGRPSSTAAPVVLVEDDADLLEVLSRALRAQGVDAVPARTEDQAVELITRLRPRLVLLDVELAEGSGFGVAARIRSVTHLTSTPVVVATVHDLDAEARERLTVGPTRFVRKGRGQEDVVQVLLDVVLSTPAQRQELPA